MVPSTKAAVMSALVEHADHSLHSSYHIFFFFVIMEKYLFNPSTLPLNETSHDFACFTDL